jgi:hypothetical protein
MITLYEATHLKHKEYLELLLGVSLIAGFMLMYFIDKVFEMLGLSQHPDHSHSYSELEMQDDEHKGLII